MSRNSPVTIRDVARVAGVSTATVSRALRGLPNVDPTTRDHVLRVAERLDYVVSPAASRLASGRAGGIAVIAPFIARWYFGHVLAGAERVIQSSDFDLLVFTTGDPSEPHRVPSIRRLRRRVDGLLLIGLPPEIPDVEPLLQIGLPVTLIGSRRAGLSGVFIDDVEGARLATQHLINLGHRRIGLIAGRPAPNPFVAENDRLTGYREALRSAGLRPDPQLQVPGFFTVDGGERAMGTLLARRSPPSAVFAMSDEMAFGALRALRRHGLRPGEDVAVVGFDGHEMAEVLDLTTVAQPVEHMGELGARLLLDQLRGGGRGESHRLDVALCIRGSSSRASAQGRSARRPAISSAGANRDVPRSARLKVDR
ncbi:MAG: LacI family transcriptional regulator [Acidothermus sp.]|nr:LacI family transcriptional regulator [Acidothermus sp.]